MVMNSKPFGEIIGKKRRYLFSGIAHKIGFVLSSKLPSCHQEERASWNEVNRRESHVIEKARLIPYFIDQAPGSSCICSYNLYFSFMWENKFSYLGYTDLSFANKREVMNTILTSCPLKKLYLYLFLLFLKMYSLIYFRSQDRGLV